MKKRELKIRFNTPCFLGNAEQNGQWRTPPFKALIRQWWRIYYAARCGFSVEIETMRNEEGRLFGDAGSNDDRPNTRDQSKSGKSNVIIRLDKNMWNMGKLTEAPDIGSIQVGNNRLPGALYSGYGPVMTPPRSTQPKLRGTKAIQASEEAILRIAFPESSNLEQVLALMNSYGTIGGRSRNGWGSFELAGDLPEPIPIAREWKEAMELDWPHALGEDCKGLLVWNSEPQTTWQLAMNLLAATRARMRRKVPDRSMLAYPGANQAMPGWSSDDRVPNSIRFKVVRVGNNNGQFQARIFHIPCRPAQSLWRGLSLNKQQGFQDCFQIVHAFLDSEESGFAREGATL